METGSSFPHKLRYRQLLIAVFIILLAFGLRGLMLYQRAANDPSVIPQRGTDQFRYLRYAGEILAGRWPTEPHYFHPAPSYVFAAISAVVGSSIVQTSLALALLDALTTGLLLATAWLITKNEWAGYLAALLYAFFPAGMLYATTPLTQPIAVFLLALFCFMALWQGEKLRLPRTLLLGLVAGGIALTRLNTASGGLIWPMVALRWLQIFTTWSAIRSHGLFSCCPDYMAELSAFGRQIYPCGYNGQP